MVSPLVLLNGVFALRGGRPALRAIDLTLAVGARVGLFGPGGSGKTSLLKILAGLWRPSKGELRWTGDAGRPTLGMVFQRDALFDGLPLLDNVAYPLRARAPDEAKALARRALRAVGLAPEDEAKRPSELSGGMRKRAGVARVLCAAPAVKLYDEPVAGLDPLTAAELLAVLSQAHDPAGATVVAAADPTLLWDLVDQAALLDGGALVAFGTPAELSRQPVALALLGD